METKTTNQQKLCYAIAFEKKSFRGADLAKHLNDHLKRSPLSGEAMCLKKFLAESL